MISARDLVKNYGDFAAAKGISFEVRRAAFGNHARPHLFPKIRL